MKSVTEYLDAQNIIGLDVNNDIWKCYLQQLDSMDWPREVISETQLQLEASYLQQQLSNLDTTMLECLPDFLIISPGKTGTTWLSQNLSCHPEIFLPEIKEIKFFSTYWRWFDINWYLKHFQNTTGLQKGEATPAYATLPTHIIKLIKLLIPNLKLVYLMRDPIDRAWSHAKHEYKYHQSSFYGHTDNLDTISNEKFINSFTNIGSLSHGDYLGCLNRWLLFFPKEQFFVRFYESIKNNPKKLLIEIFDFLEVERDVDWSKFPISERILQGLEKEIGPDLVSYLRSIYGKKTRELSSFLKEEFNIEPPAEWTNTLGSNEVSLPLLIEESYKGFNIFLFESKYYALSQDIEITDFISAESYQYQLSFYNKCFTGSSHDEAKQFVDHLFSFNERLLTTASLGEILSSDPLLIEENYKGFNILLYRYKLYALALDLGHVNLTALEEETLVDFQRNKQCIVAYSLDIVKQLVSQLALELIEEEYWGFNLIRYKGRYVALALTLGPVDLANLDEQRLTQYQASNQYLIGYSLDEVKSSIHQMMYQKSQKESAALQQELMEIKSSHWFQIMSRIRKIRN